MAFENINNYLMQGMDEDVEFMPLLSLEEDDEKAKIKFADEVPILPLKNTVLFPGVVIPITVGRDKSIKAVKEAYAGDKIIGVIAQQNSTIEEPEEKDLFNKGTLAKIVKMLKMPDGSTTAIIQGKKRFRLDNMLSIDPYFKAKITQLPDIKFSTDQEFLAIIGSLKDMAAQLIRMSPNIPTEANIMLKNIDSPAFLINFIASNLSVEIVEKQKILEMDDLKLRSEAVLKHLEAEIQMLELKNKIQNKVRTDIEKQQRDYFLQQQMKTIQEELGGDNVSLEIKEIRAKALKKKWSKAVAEQFEKEVQKIERMNPAAAEYSVILNYLELLLDLPWDTFTKDKFDLKRAKKILDEDHFGLEKVKDRILEYLAVLKLKGDMKSPILCLVGPPGVGKTSLGKSVAKALKRKYVRMALGGLHDEAEIRGHRKTYIGAMPGRVIQSLRKAKTSNPVFVLDEIDKVGADYKGDPSSALLEVLDPEQNSAFYDQYVELEYDLSKVLFIATANSVATIQPALRDRMETIEISGYSTEEKIEIAKKHLVPKELEVHGLKPKHVQFDDKVLRKIIEDYTRESGVRDLERKIAAVMRHIAKNVAMNESYNAQLTVKDIEKMIGKQQFDNEIYKEENPAGVAVGLAWTAVGGEILYVETAKSQGKGNLKLTGNLGDVMKESASTALSFLRSHASDLKLNPEDFEKTDVHVHVPEGAVPKDGSSAGVTMLSSIASSLTGKKVKPFLAMTGEITLRGKVLPVGGIKEKILAAQRAGMKEVMLCKQNEKDVAEIKPDYISHLKFHYVDNMLDVLNYALVN